MTLQKDFDKFNSALDNLFKVMKEERVLQKLMLVAGILFAINMSITCAIYALKHPSKTQTEVFLHIPESFEWNFK